MLNKLSLLASSFVFILSLSMPQLSYGTETKPVEDEESQKTFTLFSELPLELQLKIFEEDKTIFSGEGQNPGALRLVCKDWKAEIDRLIRRDDNGKIDKNLRYRDLHPLWKRIVHVSYGGLEHDSLCNTFANASLIYKKGTNDEVVLPFSDLIKNPFEGTFDLSDCGNTSQYLRITTNPATFFKVDDKGSGIVNILIAPHFLIEKLTNTDKERLEACFAENWNKDEAPIVMGWRWSGQGGVGSVVYLAAPNLKRGEQINLGEAARAAQARIAAAWMAAAFHLRWLSCSFVSQSKDY